MCDSSAGYIHQSICISHSIIPVHQLADCIRTTSLHWHLAVPLLSQVFRFEAVTETQTVRMPWYLAAPLFSQPPGSHIVCVDSPFLSLYLPVGTWSQRSCLARVSCVQWVSHWWHIVWACDTFTGHRWHVMSVVAVIVNGLNHMHWILDEVVRSNLHGLHWVCMFTGYKGQFIYTVQSSKVGILWTVGCSRLKVTGVSSETGIAA